MADVSVDPECNDAKELFGQGVRAYVLQDYEVAVSTLSKVSELLAHEHNDDSHESLGKVYLYYGKALLGLSRLQNEALGDAVPKSSTEDSEESSSEETEHDEDIETEETSVSSSLNEEPGPSAGAAASASQEKSNGEPGPSADAAASTGQEENNEDPGHSNQEEVGEEEASDLQVAWEVLELAKKIFDKKDDKRNLADTLIVLGEVSLESENFESAINDIKQGLEIQKELFAKDSRAVAETLYKLGMAYSTNSQMDEAIDSFNASLEYLRNRIHTLEELKTKTDELREEIEEIQGLIPEIEDKIADMRMFKDEAKKKLAAAFNGTYKQPEDSVSSSSNSKQATNISHLVKRKRKLDEVGEKAEENPTKKPATEK